MLGTICSVRASILYRETYGLCENGRRCRTCGNVDTFRQVFCFRHDTVDEYVNVQTCTSSSS